jgi:hypothetical protein
MSKMRCKRCGANENRIDGFCSFECKNYYDLELRIAELEAFIDQLIEAGDAVVADYCNETLSPYGSQIVRIWQLLVEDLKERAK